MLPVQTGIPTGPDLVYFAPVSPFVLVLSVLLVALLVRGGAAADEPRDTTADAADPTDRGRDGRDS